MDPATTDRVPEPVGEIAGGPTTTEPTAAPVPTPAAARTRIPIRRGHRPSSRCPIRCPSPRRPAPTARPQPRERPASITPPTKARTVPAATRRPAKPTAEVATLDQIRAAVSARDWSTALQKCGNTPRKVLTGQVRGACALAACAAKRQTEARKYSAGLAQNRITAIRQSCLSRGISID